MAKLQKISNARIGEADLQFYCKGCKCHHGVWTKREGWTGASWSFNNDFNKPTISPSIKVTYPTKEKINICHSFIKDGKIQYLNDCTHELAGQTIDLPEID